MLISTKGRYALRVLIDMAEHSGNEYIKLKDIAERQEISEKYLESIVKQLVINKIVTGLRGKGGGYKLSKQPDEINVGDILRFMEGSLAPVACLEENSLPCPKITECRTREFWSGLDDAIRRYTDSFTIADLTRKQEAGNDYVI
ncbi:RrF2 family transcriptional regulator [Lachnoclostridium sp. MSJ-17]|uniref:RrF2 family transcriptional regulator n=1 Tax=Lachnoclostridium sp. MSJ-17 TaxID=2841516 RepID=UPI001C10BC9A|nr:Rrf2 family transcriptional regulator [Lachnoclostridium sp. MSJ-17]MBU5461355.1 Rrf2 family transcriptional regulator [Lachnoclostridium sp. MSJ-17]